MKTFQDIQKLLYLTENQKVVLPADQVEDKYPRVRWRNIDAFEKIIDQAKDHGQKVEVDVYTDLNGAVIVVGMKAI